MDRVRLCGQCREAVSSPLSPAAIARNVARWLPGGQAEGFRAWQQVLDGAMVGTALCGYCYLKEVHQWLQEQDPVLAEAFLRLFSFGFSRAGLRGAMEVSPVLEMEEPAKEYGICDDCGEYADSLEYIGGEWLCAACGKFA
ncbi:MAG: hypothetical protein HY520_00140 [Candidatus Aenigmarchaeota archaeon]|nr:hypothetical protein [Candidatus Aenigmarchaeota archaeon]